jgi:hypothetical protein
MSTVTYKNQPAIQAKHGNVPEQGYSCPYVVKSLLWPADVHTWIYRQLIGFSLHVCCGKSKIGHIRVDLHESGVDVRADAAKLPFKSQSFDTVLIDPPYNGVFQWNHDMLAELSRVARQRIIFQHWFIPADRDGRYKKCHRFQLSNLAVWQGQTYFGRVQVISIFDSVQSLLFSMN